MREHQSHPYPSPPIPKSTTQTRNVQNKWQFVQFFPLMSEDIARFSLGLNGLQ